MKSLTLGQFYPANSCLHRMDPRAKLTSLFLFYIFIFLINDNLGYGLAVLFTLTIIAASRVPFKVYWQGSRFILLFLILAAALNIFFTQGEEIWAWGLFSITKEGIYASIYMALRLIALILTAYALTYTTTPWAITNALENMAAPLAKLKLPVKDVSLIISIALRFIPTIIEEAETIKKAQRSRGVDFSLRQPHVWAQNMVSLTVPLFVSAFRRSEELALAMEARGYGSSENPTILQEMKLKNSDLAVMLLTLILVLATAIYRWFI